MADKEDKGSSGDGEEIVLSIEETNAIREKLGLKPLKMEETKDEKVRVNSEKIRKEREQEERAAEVQAKVAEMRSKRIANQAIADKSIAEELEDEPDSVNDWVAKMRKKKEESEQAAAKAAEEGGESGTTTLKKKGGKKGKKAKKSAAEGYTAGGLTVAHTIDEFEEGEMQILTLRDSSILDENNLGINEDEDVLENVKLVETEKRDRNKNLKKLRPGYAGYDDEEFDEKGEPKQKNVLAKYDRDDENYQRGQIKLNDTGVFDDVKAKRLEEMRRKLEAAKSGRAVFNLSASASNVSKPADYMTMEEAAVAFKKPAMKKKKKIRKKKFDLSSLGTEDANEDHGSRSQVDKGVEEAQRRRKTMVEARKNYEKALGKANDMSEKVLKKGKKQQAEESETGAAMDVDEGMPPPPLPADEPSSASYPAQSNGSSSQKPSPFPEFDDEEDDDAELQAALARARRHAQREKKSSAETLAEEIAREKEEKGEGEDGEDGSGGVLLTATSEFVRGIELHQDDEDFLKEREKQFQKEFKSKEGGGEEREEEEEEETAPAQAGGWVTHDGEDGGMELEKKHELDPEEAKRKAEEVAFIKDEPALQRGLGGALELLRKRGGLEKNDVIRAGRAKDERMAVERNANEISIDRYDEYGRLMTTKEAWRALCHDFHGIKPGKKRQEKMLRKWKDELQQRGLGGSEKMVKQALPLENTLAKTGQAYIVYKGGSIRENLKEERKRAKENKEGGGERAAKKTKV
mmetsp:Transcript_20157/g.51447  ORF Transcript_20157/g.51447 Transcript_20157/m.51447 type:complete len:747 (-) Transcript_20157:27-2267(-)